ncbi:MAG: 4'-phosphopantetheinyl transferase superfamily protein [Lachnospiraceae bacterium]|nr:4'-phosphopantetheinyl transferase superfamily protein [Lachnospiraceae bacterium]
MKLYVRKIEDYTNENTELLEDARRVRLARIKNAKVRAECIASGMLLREALADYGYPVQEKPLELVYGPEGKPELKPSESCETEEKSQIKSSEATGASAPYFSISHSDSIVVCVVDDEPVGVDTEKFKKVSPLLPKRVLSEEENADYCRILDERSPEAAYGYFTVRWTEKESIAKLIGKGIGMDFRTIDPSEYRLHTVFRTIDGEEYVITTAQYKNV